MDNFESARQFFMDGLGLLEAGHYQAAENQFARSLALLPGRASTLANLAAVKIKLNKFAEAEPLARQAVAQPDAAPEARASLALALAGLGRHDEALQACEQALARHPASAKVWLTKAMILLELKRGEEALPACEQALALDAGQPEIVYIKSLVLKELGRADEAKKIYRQSLELKFAAAPVFSAERRTTQKADVLIVNDSPTMDDSFREFAHLHLHCPNFPGQLATRFLDEFHFAYVFAGKATGAPPRGKIPRPDFILNNHTNGEVLLAGGELPELTKLVDSFGVPVINHPKKAVQTARDVSARSLDGIPGVVVPKTLRFSPAGKTPADIAHEIEEQFNYPLITRTLAAQRGIGMTKVDSRAALDGVLETGLMEKDFFVTQFVDCRGDGQEFFRKLRAAIVKDDIVIVRADYDTFWNVHGRKSPKRVPFYLENRWVLDEERRICLDPEAALGRATVQSLRAIRKQVPLEVFGMDFGVDTAGRVVFYEGNATMNLFSTACKEVPNPPEAEERLKAAFRRYFLSLLTHR